MSTFPYLAPPDDGLTRAFADARRRRLRNAGASTSTLAAAIVVVAALVGGQSTQSLVQQPAPEQPAVTSVVPGPVDSQQQPVGNTVAQTALFSGAGTSGGFLNSPGTAGPGTPGGTATAPGAKPTPVKPYSAGPISTSTTITVCKVPAQASDATSSCGTTSSTSKATDGTYLFQSTLCKNSANTNASTTFHFAHRNEVDFVVTRAGKEVWRWSRWHPDGGAAHTLDELAGTCADWSFSWTGVDGNGKKLAKGGYAYRVQYLAQEAAGVAVQPVAFDIT